MDIGQVHIRKADAATVGEIPGGRDLLGHRPGCRRGGQDRRVIGTGDGDVDLLGDGAALAIAPA